MTEIKRPDGCTLLHITHHTPAEPVIEAWEHGLIWHGVDEVIIELDNLHWYGQGSLGNQLWPLEKMAQYEAAFMTSDNGATGLLTIQHPFWFTSNGAGILVESDVFRTSFNAPLTGEPPVHSFVTPAPLSLRPQCADGLETDHLFRISGHNLSVRFFLCNTPRDVVEAFWDLIEVSQPPPAHLTEKALWTTWAHFKNDIAHEKIVEYAHQIISHNFSCAVLGIDAKWQKEFGDTQFDPDKFPDPQATVDALHQLGMQVTLWCMPFYSATSQHFQPAIDQDYAIKRTDGALYVGQWWEGQAVFLDVTHPAATQWHLDNLTRLAQQFGIDGFKFDAGEAMFYNIPNTRWHNPLPPNCINRLYIEQIAARYPWSDIRSGWETQAQTMLFRQWDKSSAWGFDNGLASCITQAMTLNLLGYPYSFPDMIGGNQYADQIVTSELLIRWTQAVAPMPVIQFSIPPWEYGEECALLCARYANLHGELNRRHRDLIEQQVPIVRPLWWIAPADEAALTIDDQYLIGNDLLVAPVIQERARARDVYLPSGKWRNYWNHDEIYQGGWLRNYPAPLDVLPLFERIGE